MYEKYLCYLPYDYRIKWTQIMNKIIQIILSSILAYRTYNSRRFSPKLTIPGNQMFNL